MTSLKEIESWCYKQIELKNRLYDMQSPAGVHLCCLSEPGDIAMAKRVHVFRGIELIAAALKLPIKIEHLDDYYEKSVTHLGVKFFQMKKL